MVLALSLPTGLASLLVLRLLWIPITFPISASGQIRSAFGFSLERVAILERICVPLQPQMDGWFAIYIVVDNALTFGGETGRNK